MTGRTHDLAAFTALNLIIVTQALPNLSLGTALVAFSANMVGGLAPDLDQPTTDFWHKLRAGGILGKLISPLLGGHRYISHSIAGMLIFGFIAYWILNFAKSFLIVDTNLVWWSFMIGYVSHLIMDSFTKEGVPWLFPLPFRLGFPPLAFLRLKTGGLIEKSLIFPGLLLLNIYLIYQNYSHFLVLFRQLK
jgi:inner membrane protein